jgi:molecular chaperone DnaK (HSP70)
VVEEFFGKKPLKGINPNEVVAIGAAIQGYFILYNIYFYFWWAFAR